MRVKLYTKTHKLSDQEVMVVMAGKQVITKTEYVLECRSYYFGILKFEYFSNMRPNQRGLFTEVFGFRPRKLWHQFKTPSWLIVRWRDKWKLSEKYWNYKAQKEIEYGSTFKKPHIYRTYRDGCMSREECCAQFWESIKLRLQWKI